MLTSQSKVFLHTPEAKEAMSDEHTELERILRETPPAAQAFYSHVRNAEPLVLFKGDLEVRQPRRVAGRRLPGTVVFRWLPTPRVEAHFVITRPTAWDYHRLFDWASTIQPVTSRPPTQRPKRDAVPRTRVKSTTMRGSCDLHSPEIGEGSRLTEVRLHIANFPLVHGRVIAYDRHLTAARLAFSWNGWALITDQVQNAAEADRDLSAHAGYRLTHVASLRRQDNGTFSAADAEGLAEAFGYFLMFACAANCGPLLPVGFDATGHPAWASWRTPGVDPWHPRFMWLDTIEGVAQLEHLFPLFMDKWSDPLMEKVLRRVLHYYVASNNPPSVDASMTLAFIALEILERITLPGVRGDADTRLRLMLEHYHIPRTIPRGLRHLMAVKNANSWNDAPKTLAEMRHRVTHPDPHEKDLSVDARVQAWLLVMWYVELLILALLDYGKEYRNRLSKERWTGQVEAVPWRARPVA